VHCSGRRDTPECHAPRRSNCHRALPRVLELDASLRVHPDEAWPFATAQGRCGVAPLLDRQPLLRGTRPTRDRDARRRRGRGVGVVSLWWNAPPAKIIMGDTGAMAIGGLVAAMAMATRTVLLLPVIGGLFVIVTMSLPCRNPARQFSAGRCRSKRPRSRRSVSIHLFDRECLTERIWCRLVDIAAVVAVR
jgi:hypothetical protein